VRKPLQALINIPLTIAIWVPRIIHALLVVHNHYADMRTARLIEATRERRQ